MFTKWFAKVGATLVCGIVVNVVVFPVEADMFAPEIVISPIWAELTVKLFWPPPSWF